VIAIAAFTLRVIGRERGPIHPTIAELLQVAFTEQQGSNILAGSECAQPSLTHMGEECCSSRSSGERDLVKIATALTTTVIAKANHVRAIISGTGKCTSENNQTQRM